MGPKTDYQRLVDSLELIAISARELYKAALSRSTPYLRYLCQQLEDPRAGDLVVKLESAADLPVAHQIGYLQRVSYEHSVPFEEWPKATSEGEQELPPLEKIWCVSRLDTGEEVEWRTACSETIGIGVLNQPFDFPTSFDG